jgi:hypothetical protein
MKIEIEIDIESMVREAIKASIAGNNTTVTNSAKVVLNTADGSVTGPDVSNVDVDWEFAPKLGKRRNKTEQALHEKELALGRRLTPEEKGEAGSDITGAGDQHGYTLSPEEANKNRIDGMVKQANEAAAKELIEEGLAQDAESIDPVVVKDIPVTEEVNIDSLFK